MNFTVLIIVFIISTLIGYKLINKVPSLLHTPLMSGMNAFSGVTILGALVSTAFAVIISSKILGAMAIILAMINLVGGFLITDKMLRMFSPSK
ncbi:MAG: NAD(P) transhydrogenase subunit alpha [Thermodesulfobacteriota bacterium]|nr:NAD(P) transhydrogenase subunit alpha [Thermodesulfobacteriota bacterium]